MPLILSDHKPVPDILEPILRIYPKGLVPLEHHCSRYVWYKPQMQATFVC